VIVSLKQYSTLFYYLIENNVLTKLFYSLLPSGIIHLGVTFVLFKKNVMFLFSVKSM